LGNKISTINDIRKLINKHGKIFVRWSSDPKLDLQPNKKSKDYVTGNYHNGLSAIEINKDMTDAEIMKYVNEYGFGRISFEKNKPHFYLAEKVGKDTDGYPSINPSVHIGTASDDFLNQIDNGLSKKMELQEALTDAEERLKIVQDKFARQILLSKITEIKAKLAQMQIGTK
jgi:hypothetical protein